MSYNTINFSSDTTIHWVNANTYVEDFIPSRIIFNGRTTIVYWKDGSKTVVKCSEGEQFIPEVGVAQAIVRKVFKGNRSEFIRQVESAYVQPEPVKKSNKNGKA